jgi:hypothetical protein
MGVSQRLSRIQVFDLSIGLSLVNSAQCRKRLPWLRLNSGSGMARPTTVWETVVWKSFSA